jgi:hypothetical protein
VLTVITTVGVFVMMIMQKREASRLTDTGAAAGTGAKNEF